MPTNDSTISGNHAKIKLSDSYVTVTDWKNGAGSPTSTYVSLLPKTKELDKTIVRLRLKYSATCEFKKCSAYGQSHVSFV